MRKHVAASELAALRRVRLECGVPNAEYPADKFV